MDLSGFVRFFQQLWLSRLPLKLAYAICTAAVFELLVWLVASRIRRALRPALMRDRRPDVSARTARARMLLRPPIAAARAVLYAIALAIILRIFGFSIQPEVLPIAAIAIAAGLVAAWRPLADCIAGWLILYDHTVAPGEEVTIGDLRGTVEALTLRYIRLRLADGSLATIPCSAARTIINHSRAAASQPGQSQSAEADDSSADADRG